MRAFVCGCVGPRLTAAERAFLRDADPFGVILFKRNIEAPDQVRELIGDIRAALGRPAHVLIDQEGGRVQRFGPPHWRRYPPAARFEAAGPRAAELTYLSARLMGTELLELGVTIDCAPVLDVPAPGSHDVIGDRAYARDPARVATLGRAAAQGLLDAGVMPVIKHVPGHGRALADSHHDLPKVTASRADLDLDFAPFRANADLPAAMTAHVVFTALDPERPATISPIVVRDIVRGAIGFGGLLFSDDLSMKALAGTFRDKTEALFAAGVDIALHCNGDLDEARAVLDATPALAGPALARAEAADAAVARAAANAAPWNVVDAASVLDAALAGLA